MFAMMPLPVFTGDRTPAFHRPAKSSPLSSSSPIRASSPPPLGTRDPNTLPHREINSSPIPAPKFAFASRPAKPNPVLRKREDAQEGRRKLFLKNVRQRADDQRWERRGGDQELLKLEWFSLDRELRQAKNSDMGGVLSEAEIEDAAQLRDQPSVPVAQDSDAMMVDALAQEEEAELDAMIASMEPAPSSSDVHIPDSPHWSDDEDYDALFMDFVSQEGNRAVAPSGQMDMS